MDMGSLLKYAVVLYIDKNEYRNPWNNPPENPESQMPPNAVFPLIRKYERIFFHLELL